MNLVIRSIRRLFDIVCRVVTAPRIARRDLELLDRWSDHAVNEGDANALESRLFFDPSLLRAAHLAQSGQIRERRAGRLMAMLLVGVIALGTGGELQADEGEGDVPTEPADGDEGSIWDWLDDMFGTTSDDEGGGSNDPETGED